jgi:hypothetical protein
LRVDPTLGYRGVDVLQSSPAGHSIYIGLGFEDFGAVSMFFRARSRLPLLLPRGMRCRRS